MRIQGTLAYGLRPRNERLDAADIFQTCCKTLRIATSSRRRFPAPFFLTVEARITDTHSHICVPASSRLGLSLRFLMKGILMSSRSAFSSLAILLMACAASAQVAVPTQHNDNYRTGQNTKETVLTPALSLANFK